MDIRGVAYLVIVLFRNGMVICIFVAALEVT